MSNEIREKIAEIIDKEDGKPFSCADQILALFDLSKVEEEEEYKICCGIGKGYAWGG